MLNLRLIKNETTKSRDREIEIAEMDNDFKSLIKLMSEVAYNKISFSGIKANLEDFQNKDIAKIWNDMITRVIGDTNKTVVDLNDGMDMVTKVDYVQRMVASVKNDNQLIQSMSENGLSLASSLEDTSKILNEISTFAEQAFNKSAEGALKINNSINLVRNSFDDMLRPFAKSLL